MLPEVTGAFLTLGAAPPFRSNRLSTGAAALETSVLTGTATLETPVLTGAATLETPIVLVTLEDLGAKASCNCFAISSSPRGTVLEVLCKPNPESSFALA